MTSVNNQELVSIITPLFNAEQFLPATIKSVIDQSYTNWEMIIVDDCSTDSSLDVAKGFSEKDQRIRIFQQPVNNGPAACRNLASAKANGRYIAFLDSDDLWDPEKLSKQIEFMKSTSAVFSYTSYKKVNNKGAIGKNTIRCKPRVNYSQLLNSNIIGCLTVMYDTKEISKRNFVDTDHEDYVLWLSILKEGYLAYGLDDALAYYRTGNVSISSNKLKAMGFQWNIYRNIEHLSLFGSAYHFLRYAYNGLVKLGTK